MVAPKECFYGGITYSEFTPLYHKLGLRAHEEGVETDMINGQVHPALLG